VEEEKVLWEHYQNNEFHALAKVSGGLIII
jgi:hypothetical protein